MDESQQVNAGRFSVSGRMLCLSCHAMKGIRWALNTQCILPAAAAAGNSKCWFKWGVNVKKENPNESSWEHKSWRIFLLHFLNWKFHYFYFVCFLPEYMSIHPVFEWSILVQKRALDTLELGLQMVLSHKVSAGNWSWFLWKNNKYSNQLSHLSSSCLKFVLECSLLRSEEQGKKELLKS